MRPSTPELLGSIAAALEQQVLPVVQDKWAASTLRSAMQLLRYLALRVPSEPAILRAQAADLQLVLTQVTASIERVNLADLLAKLQTFVAQPQPDALDNTALETYCESGLRVIEALIAARDRLRSATGSSATHDMLIDCLQRQLARERDLILPFHTSPPI